MTSNPAFTERNIQKANAYLLYSRQEQKSLVTYHTLQSLYVCVWLVNTLTSTAPIGSPIICMWSPADVCEQWEKNLSFSSADAHGACTRDEPLRTSSWEASLFQAPRQLFACLFLSRLAQYLRPWKRLRFLVHTRRLKILWRWMQTPLSKKGDLRNRIARSESIFLSGVEGLGSRVEGSMSRARVPCRGFLHKKFFLER